MILPGPTHPIDHRPRRDSYARNHLERARARGERRLSSPLPFLPLPKIGGESGPDRDYSRARGCLLIGLGKQPPDRHLISRLN